MFSEIQALTMSDGDADGELKAGGLSLVGKKTISMKVPNLPEITEGGM